jgi:hypothetical protein
VQFLRISRSKVFIGTGWLDVVGSQKESDYFTIGEKVNQILIRL